MSAPSPELPPCAVAEGAVFDGLLSFWGAARIEGRMRGEVAARGRLDVGPAARVAARIEVDVLVVAGVVEGEITARERIEVQPGARVVATIRTPRLVLAEGAVFEGRLEMTGGPGSAAAAA